VVHRLYLLRHAKSSWDDESLPDHDRPLAPRGRRDVKRIAAYIGSSGIEPAFVLCSSARRTRETLAGIGLALGDQAAISVEPALYGADDDELLARLRDIPEQPESVLLIGHNPGVQDLALRLAREGSELGRLQEKFPTGGLATLELTCSWAELGDGAARLADFVVPRELG
jgi:phosphohistidine phosphatase